ncbi:MAG: hypothetical protein QOH27_1268 [Mycobacterium sp.]|nr:hypothetical protein [Mycobacterium sp.]
MAALTQTFAGGAPAEEMLSRVTTAAVDLINGVDCADVLVVRDGHFDSAAPTSDLVFVLDAAQQDAGKGPCLDAIGDRTVIRSNDLRTEPRWPHFARIATAAGVHSVLSYRLDTYGAKGAATLSFFGCKPEAFGMESQALGATLAAHASIALITDDRQHQFESALASRDVIGQAKGIIMERFNVDAVRAFEMLRKISQTSNTPVNDIARRLTSGEPAGWGH